MEELIQLVTTKLGLSADKAKTAINAALGFLRAKMPDAASGQFDNVVKSLGVQGSLPDVPDEDAVAKQAGIAKDKVGSLMETVLGFLKENARWVGRPRRAPKGSGRRWTIPKNRRDIWQVMTRIEPDAPYGYRLPVSPELFVGGIMTLSEFYDTVARRADTATTKITASDTRRVLSEAFQVLAKCDTATCLDVVAKGVATAAKKKPLAR